MAQHGLGAQSASLATLLCDRLAVNGFVAEPDQALQDTITRMLEASRTAWPVIALDDGAFLSHLAERIASRPHEHGLTAAILQVRTPDLYLACACALGSRLAIAEFEQRFMAQTKAVIRRVRADAGFVEEVQQQLRHNLFVSSAGRPAKILDYSGLGSLDRWVCSVAHGTALNWVRDQARNNRREELSAPAAPTALADPELAFIKRRYRQPFQMAFKAAWEGLSKRELTLLRFNLCKGLSIDKIGAIYGIHRSTAARWLIQARAHLLERTRQELRQRLQIRRSELDSFVGLLRSNLSASVLHSVEKGLPAGD